MTDLVVCVSRDENTWPHIQRLIRDAEWSNIYAVIDAICNGKFKADKKVEFIAVDFSAPVSELIAEISRRISGRFSDFEVALNLVSGNGKEHMAMLSAVLRAGVGIRLVAVTREGVKEL